MASKVFVNYRRDDSRKDARHLATLLEAKLGRGRVFIDLKGLDGAGDWLHELERQVAQSSVMLSVIGRDWLEIKNPKTGKRRIDEDQDFVRFELAEAFRREIPVVPVLVDGALMPGADELPQNLLLLTRPQAELLRAESFDADVAKIVRRIHQELAKRRRAGLSLPVAAAAVSLAATGGIAAGPWTLSTLDLPFPGVTLTTVERLERVEAQVTSARVALNEERVRTRNLSQANDTFERERDQARTEASKATEAMRAAEARGAKSETAATQAEGRGAKAEAEAGKLRADLDARLKAVTEAEARAAKAAADLKARAEEAERARASATQADAERKKVEVEAAKLRTDLDARSKAASEAEARAAKSASDLKARAEEVDRLRILAAQAEAERKKVETEAGKLRADLDAVRKANDRDRAGEAARRDPLAALVPGSGQSARDCWTDAGQQVCGPEMVVVPKGSFLMGSPKDEAGRDSDEDGPDGKPLPVTIGKPFAVGKFEVATREYLACVAAKQCRAPEWDEAGSTHNLKTGSVKHYAGFTGGDQPIVGVSWSDARAYATWLSSTTGKSYRLLSEAEWEYTARGVTSTTARHTRFHFDDAETLLDNHAWYAANAGGKTHPVGGKRPNAFGVHDMHGNVWEWTEDCWNDSHVGNPADGNARTTQCKDDSRRVLRGGSWSNSPQLLRAADRNWLPLGLRSGSIGFRPARSVSR